MPAPFRSLFRSGALGIPSRAFGAGGRGTNMFPIMEAVIEIPDLMVSPKSRTQRVHNQAVRKAMEKEMLFHHKVRIPEHFNRFRQKKYNYARRSDRTRAIKQRRNQADLVRSSRTKRRMTKEITMRFRRGGPTGAVLLNGILKWPPGFRFNSAASQGVTPEVMADEISRWTLREERTAARHIVESYVQDLNTNLSKRARRAIRPKLAKLGIR